MLFCDFLQKLTFIIALVIASVAGKPDVSHLKDGYDYPKPPGCGAEGCGYDYPKPDVPFDLPSTYLPPVTT